MASVVRRVFTVCAASRVLLRPNVQIRETVRGKKVFDRKTLKSLYRRRLEQGPEPERPRSVWLNWNYDAEIYSFGKRLNEDFNEDALRVAFMDKSYIAKEEKRREELDMVEGSQLLDIEHNEEQAKLGEEVAESYIKGYVRHSLPKVPEEGICAISDYLMTREMLAHIGQNIGIKDLIYCEEFPPSTETLCRCFKAVIGALTKSQGKERAQIFVQDFILTQLGGKDIFDMWNLINPMGLLQDVLRSQDQEEPESRLLWKTGTETIEAAYMVGIYCNKELIGQGPGETVVIAEEMAARDALKRMFNASVGTMPFKFGKEGHTLQIDTQTTNTSMLDYAKKLKQAALGTSQ